MPPTSATRKRSKDSKPNGPVIHQDKPFASGFNKERFRRDADEIMSNKDLMAKFAALEKRKFSVKS